MTIKSKKFTKGIITKPTTSAATEEGEIRNDSATGKQKVYTEGAEREIVTADQTQTLSNKTIDSANNTVTVDADTATVSNLEVSNLKAGVLETDLNNVVDDTKLPSAQAVKTYVAQEVATKDQASEISYDNTTSGLTATNVQAAVDEVEGRLDTAEADVVTAQSTADNHIADATDAHAASAITNTPSGNLVATDVQSALNELQTEVDGVSSAAGTAQTIINDHIADTVDAHDASAISNIPAGNLAATDVQGALNELQTDIDSRALDSALQDHLNDTTDAHDASAISTVPAGNLAATDVQGALDELQSDVDTRALDTDLTTHTGATSGVHGVTGDVVGTTDTQTITNKTLTGASIQDPARLDPKKDTRANLDVYATTAQNGELVFATDEKQAYQVVDGELVSIGGSGIGGVDIFHVERFEQTEAADAVSGNNVSFLGGGSLAGTLVNETVTPIKGDRSLKYTQDVGSASDYVALPAFSVDIKERGQLAGVKLSTIYSGNDNEVDFIVYDATNSTIIGTLPLRKSSIRKVQELVFNIPETCLSLRYGFQVVIENSSAVLTLDDIEFKVDPLAATDLYASSEMVNEGPITIDGSTTAPTKGTTATDKFMWRRDGEFMEIYFEYRQTAAGSAGSGDYIIRLPSGYTIDTAFHTASTAGQQFNTVGTGFVSNTSTGEADASRITNINVVDSTGLTMESHNSGTTMAAWSGITFALNSTNVIAAGHARVKILGWSDTAQGVVVKNRSDSASVENVFSAKVENNGTTASIVSQNVDFIDSVTRTGAGIVDVVFKSGVFSVAPSITAVPSDSPFYIAGISGAVTTSGFTIEIKNNTTGANSDEAFDFKVQRQGTDYIKESEKVYTVPVGFKESIFTHASSLDFWDTATTAGEGDWDSSLLQGYYTNDIFEVEENVTPLIGGSVTAIRALQPIDIAVTFRGRVQSPEGSGLYADKSGVVVNIASSTATSGNQDISLSGTIKLNTNDIIYAVYQNNIRSGSVAIWAKPSKEEGLWLGSFGQPICYVKDVKSSGTNGGASTANTVHIRDLNTLDGDRSFVSLSSNQFTLNPGSYHIEARTTGYECDRTQAFIYNVTDSSYVIDGLSTYNASLVPSSISVDVSGVVNVSSLTTFELRQWVQGASLTGLGFASNGTNNPQSGEVYSLVKITKLR